MTGGELMETLSSMSKSELDKEVLVLALGDRFLIDFVELQKGQVVLSTERL